MRVFASNLTEKNNQNLNFDYQKSLHNEKVAKTWNNNLFVVKFKIKINFWVCLA